MVDESGVAGVPDESAGGVACESAGGGIVD
jgi:hypothetical protein